MHNPDDYRFVSVHGHFYQPPREDPYTHAMPRERDAGDFHDWNERILAECYRPNAELGNFQRMSFNIGPTLADWMRRAHPDVLRRIADSDRAAVTATGYGSAIAQSYHHTILPLANERDRLTEIRWGVRSFELLFGRKPLGIWLPETAVDTPTLEACVAEGLLYTIVAPQQVAGVREERGVFRVELPSGAQFAVVVYDAGLGGLISFNPSATDSAARFAQEKVLPLFSNRATRPTLVPIASDGEVYGHHHAFKDLFLEDLLARRLAENGISAITLDAFVQRFPPAKTATVLERSSWGCPHRLARWSTGCACTTRDSSWKQPLRAALDELAHEADAVYEREGAGVLLDPWAARDAYVDVVDEAVPFGDWIAAWQRPGADNARRALTLLEAQRHRLAMYASCAFYWEDIDRLEPGYSIRRGVAAADLLDGQFGTRLRDGFVARLSQIRGWRSELSAAQLHAHACDEQAAD
jgi:hypothetical protein